MLSFICCSGEDLIYTDASGSYSDWRMMQYAFLDGLAQLILATNLHALVQPILPEGKQVETGMLLFLFLVWSSRTVILKTIDADNNQSFK